MNKTSLISLLCALCFCFMQTSCDDETPADPCDNLSATYNGAVKGIINGTCAYDGCHNGTSLLIPDAATDFTTYSGLQASLNASKFGQRALVDKDMPNASFVPPGFPTSLTDDQLAILQCWADNGYPEN